MLELLPINRSQYFNILIQTIKQMAQNHQYFDIYQTKSSLLMEQFDEDGYSVCGNQSQQSVELNQKETQYSKKITQCSIKYEGEQSSSNFSVLGNQYYENNLTHSGKSISSQQVQGIIPEQIIQNQQIQDFIQSSEQNNDIIPKQISKYVYPSDLKARFQKPPVTIKKATNAPKFLINVFLSMIDEELPINQQGEQYRKFLREFQRKLKNKTQTRYHLMELFEDNKILKQQKRNGLFRMKFQKILSQNKSLLILFNNMIPLKNKIQYLYFSKVYEWRLNDSQLVGRFN